MRILHTSDWHLGRTFHTHSTLGAAREVLDALAAIVRERDVDVVAVAGDVFDSGVPSADAIELLEHAFRAIRSAGAQIVMTSGNHDSVTRLGMHAEWMVSSGIHVLTRHERLDVPVTLDDGFGPVRFYGIPYLEPAMLRHAYPDADIRTHERALTVAMNRIRDDLADRGGRSVVLAHCFVQDVAVEAEATDVERGGLDLVPARVFDGVDYVALGHIHGRSRISNRMRYSGAPLHYSFGEAGKPRGAWLVEIDADGLGRVDWVDLPVPRRLVQLTGTIEELLTLADFAANEADWVKAVVTDQVRPVEGMRRLQARFPSCAAFEWRPAVVADAADQTYAERQSGRSDPEIVGDFLAMARNGRGPTEFEAATVAELLQGQATAGVSA